MQGQFQGFGNSGSVAGQPSRFVSEIEQLLGDNFELDPLFLEESWTIGAVSAMENWQRRQRHQVDRERQSQAFREMDSLGTLHFVEDRAWAAESLLADRAATIASRYDAGWSQRAPEVPAARIHERVAVFEAPAYQAPAQEIPREREAFDSTEPMTEQRACILLEVTPDSTREQIRSAYRRMVGRWHPDRMQLCTEEVHRYATEQMIAINEAYRLLRASLQEQAA